MLSRFPYVSDALSTIIEDMVQRYTYLIKSFYENTSLMKTNFCDEKKKKR
jgi:hypothetical protein